MRNFKAEDDVFLKVTPKVKNILKDRLKSVKKYNRDYKELVEDILHDSFVVFRRTLVNKPLILGENIDEHNLKGYIVRIAYSIFLNVVKGNKPNYFEDIPHTQNYSLQQLTDVFGEDEFINEQVKDYAVNTQHNLDVNSIVNHINNDLNRKESLVLKGTLLGINQRDIRKFAKIKSLNIVHAATKKIRKKTLTYLGREFDTFRENAYTIKNKCTINSLNLNK